MRRLKTLPFLGHRGAVSYTVSAIIMTATTVALVLVAFFYAYQVLDKQRGMSEFEVAKKSILAFDDALENVAWKPGATRSTRFTADYGYVQLLPNANSMSISAIVDGQLKPLSNGTYPGSTAVIKYWLSTNFVSFEPNYESYILGNSSSVISSSTDPYGRSAIRQQAGWVTISLDYRVRTMRTAVIKVNGVDTNYVDIWVIRVSTVVSTAWSYVHDFDLLARTMSVRTASYGPYNVSTQSASISVQIGSEPAQQRSVAVVPGQAVFNVVVADVRVSV